MRSHWRVFSRVVLGFILKRSLSLTENRLWAEEGEVGTNRSNETSEVVITGSTGEKIRSRIRRVGRS